MVIWLFLGRKRCCKKCSKWRTQKLGWKRSRVPYILSPSAIRVSRRSAAPPRGYLMPLRRVHPPSQSMIVLADNAKPRKSTPKERVCSIEKNWNCISRLIAGRAWLGARLRTSFEPVLLSNQSMYELLGVCNRFPSLEILKNGIFVSRAASF